MTGGQLSVFERLETLAHLGNVECSLNLYPRQAGKLLDEGFELKKLPPSMVGKVSIGILFRGVMLHLVP